MEDLFDRKMTKHRFFSKKQYAEQFIKGIIRISTLKHCRELENLKGRDETEGNVHVSSGDIHIRSHMDSEYQSYISDLERMGISLNPIGSHTYFEGMDFGIHQLDNAHLLCLSNLPNPYLINNFGRFSVEIAFPEHIGELICVQLDKLLCGRTQYKGDRVDYGDQKIKLSSGPIKKSIGFLKNKKFEPEDEYRLLFHNNDRKNLIPIEISIGDISEFCRLKDY